MAVRVRVGLQALLFWAAGAAGRQLSGADEPAPSLAVKSAPRLGAPLCGFGLAEHQATVVYRATGAIGAYNHAAMLDYSVAGSAQGC